VNFGDPEAELEDIRALQLRCAHPCESGEAAAIAVALTDLYAAGATRDINASVLPSPSSKNVIHSSVPVSSSV
jgi:hypothetical protein